MSEDKGISRRDLLSQTARTGVAAGIGLTFGGRLLSAAAPARAQDARVAGANDRMVVGIIGSGSMGRGNLMGFLDHPNVECAAVCDVDTRHMAEAAKNVLDKSGKRPQEIKDFRKLLENKDIDAVLICTPDHWHALPFIEACMAGKDIFVEKPISHNIWEGRMMANAAKKYGRVVQVNTWQRSTQHFVDAIDYVRGGKLGKISVVRSWKTDNFRMGKRSPEKPPAELDYDFWVGPAVFEEYRPNRCHWDWRWYLNFAGGMTGDWGVHMMDIALLGMSKDDHNLPMPGRVSAVGGKFSAPDDDRTAPDTHLAIYQYPGWALHWETHEGDYGLDGGGDHGTEFIGPNGRLIVDRGGWRIWDRGGKEVPTEGSSRRVGDHIGNFLDCVKTRELPRSDIFSMHQTTSLCHLANLAYLAGETIQWDAKTDSVIGNKDAMNLLPYKRPYRKPWSLPNVKV